jgi:hypothetical protein
MAVNTECFFNLSHYLYSWPVVYEALPLNNQFLWLNLATRITCWRYCWPFHVYPAEDDSGAGSGGCVSRPIAGPEYDSYDAADVYIPVHVIPQRFSPLLGDL